jgi:hypothetical protein
MHVAPAATHAMSQFTLCDADWKGFLMSTPSTDELNAWIFTRLELLGIDISVLPVSGSAPATQNGILSACRSMLTGTIPVVSAYTADVEANPPALYVAPFTQWTSGNTKKGS